MIRTIVRSRRNLVVLGSLAVLVLAATGAGLAANAGYQHRLYRLFLYPAVAWQVTQGAASPEAAALRLHEFVNLNVRTPGDAPVLDDSAADTLIRGFAYCDSLVLAFVRLLEAMGIPGRMTFLELDTGWSPHSVAEVFLDGEWRVFDTLSGLTPRRPDGAIATIKDVVAQPFLLGPSGAQQQEWYRNAETVRAAYDRGLGLPGFLHARLRDAVAVAPGWLFDRLQDLYLLLPPPQYWTLQPASDGRYERAELFDDYSAPDSRLFFRARNYHVLLRTAEAERAYRELLRRYPGSRYADDAVYNLGVLQLTPGQNPVSALAGFDALLRQHPDTPWRDQAGYLQARAYEAAGDCAAAAQAYRQINLGNATGAEDARLRLALLPCA